MIRVSKSSRHNSIKLNVHRFVFTVLSFNFHDRRLDSINLAIASRVLNSNTWYFIFKHPAAACRFRERAIGEGGKEIKKKKKRMERNLMTKNIPPIPRTIFIFQKRQSNPELLVSNPDSIQVTRAIHPRVTGRARRRRGRQRRWHVLLRDKNAVKNYYTGRSHASFL